MHARTRVANDVEVDCEGFDGGEGGEGHAVDDIPEVLWGWHHNAGDGVLFH